MTRGCVLLVVMVISCFPALAQGPTEQKSASCTFQDGKSVTVRYDVAPSAKPLNFGSVWIPGSNPIVLFTETPLTVGTKDLPVGAYSLYLLPDKEAWDLIVNSDVSGSQYNAARDLTRVDMQRGEVPQAVKRFNLRLLHSKPNVCSLTVYHKKHGYWTDITEK